MSRVYSKNLQALKRFEAMHERADFELLSSAEFQFMILTAIERDMMSDLLSVELLKRIRDLRMSNHHLNQIILKSPETAEWSRIRRLALRSILTRDQGVFSLIHMGIRLHNWSQPEYEIFRTACMHEPSNDHQRKKHFYGHLYTVTCLDCNREDPQHLGARVRSQGKYSYSNYHAVKVYEQQDISKAKYLAASELIIQLLGYDLKDLLVKIGLSSSELLKLSVGHSNENWKSKLHEYCAKHKLSFPIYFSRLIEQEDAVEFEAIASIGEGENIDFSFPHRGLTEKEVEQRVSQSFFLLLSNFQAIKDLKGKQLAIDSLLPDTDYDWKMLKNNIPVSHVERLRYYCTYNKHSPPKYIISEELIEGRKQLKVTVCVTTKEDQMVSFYGLCSWRNRRSKVNKARQYVAVNLLQKLQKLK